MAEVNTVRYRKKDNEEVDDRNRTAKPTNDKTNGEFTHRESVLTVMIAESSHIRAIYHIFVVIFLLLLFDTAIYDLLEKGKINVGIKVIVGGFGDIKRATVLWLFELGVALSLHPALRIYATLVKLTKKYPDFRSALNVLGIVGIIFLHTVLIGVPVWSLSRKNLPIASSVIVTCEMFRFAMKIQATAMACISRCHNAGEGPPLPTLKQYVYFLFAPTLIYRDQYPRTKKIRWNVVLLHFAEVLAIIFSDSLLWERFILPYWSNYGKESTIDAGTVVRNMFACVVPGVIFFLFGFFCLLHAWMNAFAEMLRFADRLFYEDWWTTSQFSRYLRTWNLIVHVWLRDNIYMPLAPRIGRILSTFIVFFVSAIAHEVILALSFGFFYPILLVQFGVFGLMLLPLTGSSGRRFPNALNIIMWLSFFLGNGLLWSLYPMEYFARLNCPPSEDDSFFIPKSWSCPKIIVKPNWTFENPLEVMYR